MNCGMVQEKFLEPSCFRPWLLVAFWKSSEKILETIEEFWGNVRKFGELSVKFVEIYKEILWNWIT